MEFFWNEEKNEMLKQIRGISFNEIVEIIHQGGLVSDIVHPDKEKYPNQRVMYIDVRGYINVVPYIQRENSLFLKTIYPSRKLTKNIKWRNK